MGQAERIFEEVKTFSEDDALRAWEYLSVSGALAGLENDAFPEYPESDLLERWQ